MSAITHTNVSRITGNLCRRVELSELSLRLRQFDLQQKRHQKDGMVQAMHVIRLANEQA